MPRVKPEHKEARRSEIIEAARSCFARKGFHETTLQDVLAESELSAGCVYNYFSSKEELILAAAEGRHWIEARMIADGLKAGDPVDGLLTVAEAFITAYLGSADLSRRIAVATWSESLHNPAVLTAVRRGLHGPLEQVVRLIERGQKTGRFRRDIDAEMAARTMIALLHGFVLQKLWNPTLSARSTLTTFKSLLPSLLGVTG